MTLTDWTGFAGVAILLLAYLLSLRGIVDKESKTMSRLADEPISRLADGPLGR